MNFNSQQKIIQDYKNVIDFLKPYADGCSKAYIKTSYNGSGAVVIRTNERFTLLVSNDPIHHMRKYQYYSSTNSLQYAGTKNVVSNMPHGTSSRRVNHSDILNFPSNYRCENGIVAHHVEYCYHGVDSKQFCKKYNISYGNMSEEEYIQFVMENNLL